MTEVAILGASSFLVGRPRSHSKSISFSPQVSLHRLQLRPRPALITTAIAVPVAGSGFSSPLPLGLGYLKNRLSLRAAVISSCSGPFAVAATVDGKADLDSGGSGGEFDGKSGSGGGGEDNSGDRKGEEGSDGDNKRKMALSMSQKFTLVYAALVGVGGLMGYLKSGSTKSLLAGGISASLLYYVNIELPARPVFASSLGLGISAALLGVMGSRFIKSGKIFPAGVVSLVSFIMTGGYLHGIFRSAH